MRKIYKRLNHKFMTQKPVIPFLKVESCVKMVYVEIVDTVGKLDTKNFPMGALIFCII